MPGDLNEIERIGGEDGSGETAGDLFEAKANLNQSLADLAEWRDTHHEAVEQLTNAHDRLRKAAADMAHSVEAQRRAEVRRQQMERDAGLRQGLDTTNLALSAMEQAATEAKQKARAAAIQSDALRHTGSATADDIVAETLASQKLKTDISPRSSGEVQTEPDCLSTSLGSGSQLTHLSSMLIRTMEVSMLPFAENGVVDGDTVYLAVHGMYMDRRPCCWPPSHHRSGTCATIV